VKILRNAKSSRITTGSVFKYSPMPSETPAIILPLIGRKRRLVSEERDELLTTINFIFVVIEYIFQDFKMKYSVQLTT